MCSSAGIWSQALEQPIVVDREVDHTPLPAVLLDQALDLVAEFRLVQALVEHDVTAGRHVTGKVAVLTAGDADDPLGLQGPGVRGAPRPGSAGEEKTVSYLEAEFKKIGLKPGNPNGTYIQNAPLVGITSQPTLAFEVGGKPVISR